MVLKKSIRYFTQIIKIILPPYNTAGIKSSINIKVHKLLRMMVPSIRERYRLELMVGPVGYWEQIQAYQLLFLKSMGLKPQHSLLDIGCGPLSGGLAFISYLHSGNYVGIDIRKEAVAEAHIQLAKADLHYKKPSVYVSNSFGNDELGDRKFDFIFASQILYHLDEKKIDALFEQLSKRMKNTSKFYGDIIGYPNKVRNESHWYEFKFYLHTFEFIKSIGEKHGLKMIHLGQIEKFGYPSTVALKTNDMLELRKL